MLYHFIVLPVTIIPAYMAPSDVDLGPYEYRAASTLTLTCMVQEAAIGNVVYTWTSTSSSSLADSKTGQSVFRNQLQSRDTGTHTCTATDGRGNTGNHSIEIRVVGM